jgi:hypothetical protein
VSEPILTLENGTLRFALHRDGRTSTVDLASGIAWLTGETALQERRGIDEGYFWGRTWRYHCESYGGRFRAEVIDEPNHVVRFMLLEPHIGPKGKFTVRYSLEEEWLVIDMLDVDQEIPSLTFPTPLAADSIVVPHQQGELIAAGDAEHNRHSLIARGVPYGQGLAMRWFGGLLADRRNAEYPVSGGPVRSDDPRSRTGWMAIIENGAEYAKLIRRGTNVAPIWIHSLGSWNYRRRIRYRFVDGGYVQMAAVFRGWAQANGYWASLSEKIQARPKLGNYIGGRNVAFMTANPFRRDSLEEAWERLPPQQIDTPSALGIQHTFAQAASIVAECERLGMKRGQFKFDGWSAGGYDARHPDIWPPEAALGSVEELKALLARENPFVSCLHDNYNDTYPDAPSFPDGVARLADGSLVAGGRWSGGLAYRLNSRDSLRFGRRNLDHHLGLAPGGVYFDTLPSLPEESFEPGNECTREEGVRYRQELVRLYQDHGFVVGGEGGTEWAARVLDWYPLSAHHHGVGATPPLWSLVYHDCAVGLRSIGSPGPDGEFSPQMRMRCLENVLWGWAVTFRGFTAETWNVWKKAFAASFFVDEWHARVGTAQMTSHAYLTDDLTVERTEWSTGDAVTVNFGDEPVVVDGLRVEGRDYVVSS